MNRIWITTESCRRGQACACGQPYQGRDATRWRFFVPATPDAFPTQLCDACEKQPEYDLHRPLLQALNALGQAGISKPPIALAVGGEFTPNRTCGLNCHQKVEARDVEIVPGGLKAGGLLDSRCRRCLNSLYPAISFVIDSYLGLEALPPPPEPQPPAPPTQEELYSRRRSVAQANVRRAASEGPGALAAAVIDAIEELAGQRH